MAYLESPPEGEGRRVRRNPQSRSIIGKILVESFGMKYLSAVRPSFQVIVEKEIFTSNMATFNHTFMFSDISTEILLLVMDESSSKSKSIQYGQIVIPVAHYISISKVLPTSREWRMFLPLYKSGRAGRFRDSSLQPGSGLPKTREKIGFVDLAVTVQLLDPTVPIYRYFFVRPTSSACVRVERPYVETAVAEDTVRLQRVLQSLCQLFLLVRFPDVLALIPLGGFLLFILQPWQTPLVIFIVIFLNGLLLKTRRNFDALVVFNSFLGDDSSGGKVSSFLIPTTQLDLGSDDELTLAGIAADHGRLLERLVVSLERIVNLWGLADPKPSLIVYCIALAGSCACSLFLVFFSVRALLFIFFAFVLLVASLWGPMSYVMALDVNRLRQASPPIRKTDEPESDWNARNRAYNISRALPWPIVRLWELLWSFNYFWMRIPDDLDLAHRHIANLSIVKKDGPEMEDAEEFFKKD